MKDSPTEYLSRLRQSFEQTETLLRAPDDAGRWAAGLTVALQTLWPSSPLYACQLTGRDNPLHAIDQHGTERPEWLLALQRFLSQNGGKEQVPRQLFPMPSELPFARHAMAVQFLGASGSAGVLLLAAPVDLPSERSAILWELLEIYGGGLTAQLARTTEQEEAGRLRMLFAEQTELADLAALASPLTHEFNNFLNTLILQLMVLGTQVPEPFRADLRSIGQQAKTVAGLIRHWQQHRSQHRPVTHRLDVNAMIREVAGRLFQTTATKTPSLVPLEKNTILNPNAVVLRLALAGDLPPIEATPLDLRLLLRLLITNAAASITALPGTVVVSTSREADGVYLSIADTGPHIPVAQLPHMFEPTAVTREGTSQLEMAACEALVQRRLRGRLHGENSSGGGVVVHVRLRAI